MDGKKAVSVIDRKLKTMSTWGIVNLLDWSFQLLNILWIDEDRWIDILIDK